jgi:hypothetical protein
MNIHRCPTDNHVFNVTVVQQGHKGEQVTGEHHGCALV